MESYIVCPTHGFQGLVAAGAADPEGVLCRTCKHEALKAVTTRAAGCVQIELDAEAEAFEIDGGMGFVARLLNDTDRSGLATLEGHELRVHNATYKIERAVPFSSLPTARLHHGQPIVLVVGEVPSDGLPF